MIIAQGIIRISGACTYSKQRLSYVHCVRV